MKLFILWSGDRVNPLLISYMGKAYEAYRVYGLNGGLLLYTQQGEIYINPDGREVRRCGHTWWIDGIDS